MSQFSFYIYRHLSTICWNTNHVCPHQRRTSGGAEHLLLDPPHLHPQLRPLEEGGRGRAPPGGGQNQGREGQEARQILSVGRIPFVLPGKILLEFNDVSSR